jgi:hypothetical protein
MPVTSVIPKDMNFFSDIEQLSGVASSIDVHDDCQSQSVANGQTVHFFFSWCDAADFRDSFLFFNLLGSLNGTGTVGAFMQGIACVINRVRFLCGSELLYDLVDFNVFYQNWINQNTINTISNTFNIFMATSDSLATRQANFANVSKNYCVYLGWIVTILNMILPVSKLGQQLHLELILEQPAACIVSDAVNPTYVMQNAQYHYKQITFTSTYREMLNAKLAAGPINILYLNYANYTNQVAASTTNITNVLPWKYSRFLGFNVIARSTAAISSLTTDGKMVNYLNSSIFLNTRTKINNIYFPADSILGVPQAYDQYLEFHDLPYNIDTYAGTLWNSDPGLFEVGINVNQFPKHLTDKDYMIQGQDVSLGSSSIQHEQKFTAGTAVPQQWDYFAVFFATMNIDSNGRVYYTS